MSPNRQLGSLTAALAVVFGACGGGDKGEPAGPAKVTSVTVTAPATQLEVGATLAFSYSARDAQGNSLPGRPVSWSSSATTVATVAGDGVVSGVGAGQATITATVEGVAGSASVTVVPTPVFAVIISPRTPVITAGETVQLSAVAQDAIGRPLSGRTVTWTANHPALATVSTTGLVTGVGSGTAGITASSEGKQDVISVRIRSLDAPTISTSSPTQWTPGSPATITGTNFSTIASENEVLVNSVKATVTASTATTISFSVPVASLLPCTPTGPVPVSVVVNGESASGTANLAMATPRTLAVGEHLLLASAADVSCNEFAVTGGRYLVTAFNASQSAGSLASFQLLGAATSQAASQNIMAALPAPSTATMGPLAGAMRASRDDAFALGHMAALEGNAALMQRNTHLKSALLQRRARAKQGKLGVSATARQVFASVGPSSGASAAPVAPPNVGDRLWKRMPKTFNNYGSFDSVRVRVAYVGPKLIIMEDSTNELFGTMDAEYQAVGTDFDNNMYAVLSSFGDPLALDDLTDNNGRVIALFTRRVNEYQLNNGGSLLGFVTSCDFFAQEDPDPENVCVPSNEGEYFYAIAPNPNGLRGKYDLATWKRYTRGTMIHEMKHVVMFVQRIFLDAVQSEETWLEEATAQMATELWARKIYGNYPTKSDIKWTDGPRCDYASASATCSDPVEAILHPFQFLYTHYSANETKSIINNSDLVIYGSSWSFARWATDTYDNGNESAFTRSLVQQRDDRGITNIVNRTGRPWAELLALFSMASTADNYPGGTITDSRLRLPGWNTRDMFSGMNANLVFRNADGSTTPAFPLQWPLRVRTPTFGTFSDVARNVSQLRGGGWVAWDISGTQVAPQVLAIRSIAGGPPPVGVGMVVLRVQ
ncbi:MAG: Ig-like domain-containing protein [Cytophagaceae bacterium]|nr:Ig-like domain-containing protein [Gemmatimonadaceae bacterium]